MGYYDNGTEDQTLEQWNGHSWAKVASPTMNSTDSELYAIGASSASSIWAVGDYYNGSQYQGLALHCC